MAGMMNRMEADQVNGQDLTKSSHEDAVEAFRAAKEPIVVEVLRRVASHKSSSGRMKTLRAPSPMVTVSTQTDEYIEDAYCSAFQSPMSPVALCGFPNTSLVQPQSRQGLVFGANTEVGLTDLDMANGLEYDEDFDGDRGFEVEYEEVTLNRGGSSDKIGLTLCYGSTDDDIMDTCIFIGEVESYSIAAQDGRIREGDQILQINGVDVHSREQAIQLFSENRAEITLLLARPQLQMDDGFMDERNGGLDDLSALEALGQQRDDLELQLAQGNDEEGGTTDTATTENSTKHEKDSGVGRTDESTKNDESSGQEMLDNDCTSPLSSGNAKFSGGMGSTDLHFSNDSFTSTDTHDHEPRSNDINPEECDKFREVLETRCDSAEGSPHHGSSKSHKPAHLPRKDSQSSIEREIAALNREMEQIQIECQEIVEAHTREQHKVAKPAAEPFRSPRMVPRMGTRLDYVKQLHAVQESHEPIWVKQEQCGGSASLSSTVQGLEASSGGSTTESTKRSSSSKGDKEKDTSTTSAYNTGDSCRSTPLTLELHQASDDSGRGGHKNSMLCLSAPVVTNKPSHSDSEKTLHSNGGQSKSSKEWSSDGDARLRNGVCKSQSNTSVSRTSQTGEVAESGKSLQDVYAQYADVMYTNQANLQHTIMVQQKLFQQQIIQRARQNNNYKSPSANVVAAASAGPSTSSASSATTPPVNGNKSQEGSPSHKSHSPKLPPQQNSLCTGGLGSEAPPGQTVLPLPSTPGTSTSCNQAGVPMEWVVKRRADGSRYITRRPVRNKMLKERAKKLNEERCGITTDDDAVSELKVGRYWSKEDRKRHLEKAKDHRRKKEQLIRQRMETLKEHEESKKEQPNIVELSHRKMMKHKGKKVFDDFTTIQELLAHGNRESQSKTYNPLLSVTTV